MAQSRYVLRLGLWLAAAGLLLTGCTAGLPRLRTEPFEKRIAAIPDGAAPLLSWHGGRRGLKTYWYDQDIAVEVTAYLPPDWRNPGDGCWRAKAVNGEGKPIPFLGVVRNYTNESGNPAAVLVPPLSLDEVADGLYLTITPDVRLDGGRILSVSPTATVVEIRRQVFRPFRVKIPLIPDHESELTPAPPPLPTKPAGTPIPD